MRRFLCIQDVLNDVVVVVDELAVAYPQQAVEYRLAVFPPVVAYAHVQVVDDALAVVALHHVDKDGLDRSNSHNNRCRKNAHDHKAHWYMLLNS